MLHGIKKITPQSCQNFMPQSIAGRVIFPENQWVLMIFFAQIYEMWSPKYVNLMRVMSTNKKEA